MIYLIGEFRFKFAPVALELVNSWWQDWQTKLGISWRRWDLKFPLNIFLIFSSFVDSLLKKKKKKKKKFNFYNLREWSSRLLDYQNSYPEQFMMTG